MGPRIFIRGYDGIHAIYGIKDGLQWGRGFSSADTNSRYLVEAALRASMGPRIFIRGYVRSHAVIRRRWCRFNGAADFHPRIPESNVCQAGTPKLQWGRGFSSADTRQRAKEIALMKASMGPRIFIRGYLAGTGQF